MLKRDFPILEYDSEKRAVINPEEVFRPAQVPPACVMTFFQDILDKLQRDGKTKKVAAIKSEMGEFPVFELEFQDRKVAVCNPGVGAPLACVSMEELIALGCKKFVACGSGGVLDREILRGTVLVVESAVRQEGTSYHYLPPSREVEADRETIEDLIGVLNNHNIKYLQGKVWTTDAIFRETRDLVELRRQEGCLMVEMEASALLAVARFRGVKFGEILGAGDDVSGENWDERYCSEKSSHREKLFWLAVEAALAF